MNIRVEVTVRKNIIRRKLRDIKNKVGGSRMRAAQTGLQEMVNRAPRGRNPRAGETSILASLAIHGNEDSPVIEVGSFGAHRSRPVARFNEFGTSRMRARPFMRPARARMTKQLREDAESALRSETAGDA